MSIEKAVRECDAVRLLSNDGRRYRLLCGKKRFLLTFEDEPPEGEPAMPRFEAERVFDLLLLRADRGEFVTPSWMDPYAVRISEALDASIQSLPLPDSDEEFDSDPVLFAKRWASKRSEVGAALREETEEGLLLRP